MFPPFATCVRCSPWLGDGLQIVYGAQDLSDQDSGAYTGDISGEFLVSWTAPTRWSVTHERRTVHHESDELCRDKIRAAIHES